jgi:hypothetical protein
VDDLLAFWRARLDETEAIAQGASPGPWHLNAEGDEVLAVDDVTVAEAFALSGRQQRATASHVALHDPDRALRDVAADRAILEHHRAVGYYPATDLGRSHYWCSCGEPQPCLTVRARVSVYSDHPSYKEDWKP